MNNKYVSIIATVCRNFNDLQNFYNTLQSTSEKDYDELILVSNGVPNDIKHYLDFISANNKKIKLIYNENNLGLGYSTDQASHVAQGDYIFRCDMDLVFYSKNWINEMVKVSNINDNIGSVGTSKNCGSNYILHENFKETDIIVGCCQCIPRKTINKISEHLKVNKDYYMKKIDKKLKLLQLEIVKNQIMQDSTEDICTRVSILKRSIEKCKDLSLVGNWILKSEGYWDPNYFYGVDDQDYSLLQRFLEMKLAVCDNVEIEHRNASMSNNWKLHRHWNVWNGFHYFREKWEILLGFSWDGCAWEQNPLNVKYRNLLK